MIDEVALLLAGFDGGELQAMELRRAVLSASAPMSVDHPGRDLIDGFISDIGVWQYMALERGPDGLRAEMLRRWQEIAVILCLQVN